MPQQVDIPNVGLVEFPDEMSHDDIVGAIRTKILPQSQGLPALQMGGLMPGAVSRPEQPYTGQGQEGFTKPLLPVQLIRDPQTALEGLANSLVKGAASLTSPMGLLTAPATAVKPLQVPLAALFSVLGAKGVGQGLGELSGNPDASTGQKAEQLGDVAQSGLMMVPALVHALPAARPMAPPYKPPTIEDLNRINGLVPRLPVDGSKPVSPTDVGAAPVASPFDKGKVMVNAPEVAPSVEKPVPPSDWQQYQDVQRRMATYDFGSPEFADAWKQNEVIKNRNGGMPPVDPAKVEAPKPVSPLTFQPAIKVGEQTYIGAHNPLATLEYAKAQAAGLPKPVIQRGFLGSDGQFLTNPLDVVRAQQKAKADERTTQSTQQQETGGSVVQGRQAVEEGGTTSTAQSTPEQAQGKVPNDVRANAQGALGHNQQGVGGRSDSVVSPVQRLNKTQQAEEQVRLNKAVSGESGFILLPKDVVPKLGFAKGFKVAGEMLYNRLRNVVGETSATWQALQSAGLRDFLKEKRTTDEVKQWAEDNAPKVEVRKFQGGSQQAGQEVARIEHLLETNYKNWSIAGSDGRANLHDPVTDSFTHFKTPEEIPDKYKDVRNLLQQYRDNYAKWDNHASQPHWQSIAPKSERDMPGYVEIAVVKPHNDKLAKIGFDNKDSGIQFPPSHNFPPNTLGFVRGYIENVGGKKVFHVIEVQSDWAQRHREDMNIFRDVKTPNVNETPEQVKRLQDDWDKSHGDPLLPHYERLALKAAIEHAKSEGADAITISDSPTVALTEKHDIAAEYTERKFSSEQQAKEEQYKLQSTVDISKLNHSSRVEKEGDSWYVRVPKNSWDSFGGEPNLRKQGYLLEREAGNIMHYDQTLPKILGELTGGKGEGVEMGEHKGARSGTDTTWQQAGGNEGGGIRKDLIFRNLDGTPKTSVSGRMYDIGKKNPTPEFSLFGKDKGEAGFTINLPATLLDQLKEIGAKAKPWMNQLRGKDLPHTTQASAAVADKLYLYAQSKGISDVLAKTDPTEVLGEHYKDEAFDKKFGNVLVEYNLRATGNTSVGKPWSFPDEASYQAALKDPEVQDAIQRHADIVLAGAEARHEKLGGSRVMLDDPRMFVNLKYVSKEENLGGAARGNLKATLQKPSKFTRERKGTADEYETSYRVLAGRMIKANYAEAARSDLNDSYVAAGLGKWVKPGDAIPKDMVEIPTKLQRAVLVKDGEAAGVINQSKSLYVRKDLAPEYLQAMNVNSPLQTGALRKLADVLTRVQVSLGVDAAQHSVNITSAVNGAVRAEVGKNLVGAKELSTIADLTKNTIKVIQDSPDFQKLIGEMAKTYGLAREHHSYGGILTQIGEATGSKVLADVGGKIDQYGGGAAIKLADQVGRVTLFNIAKQLAKQGLIKDSPQEIRHFVNTQLGQYNPRLMNTFQAVMKSTFSPFIVAGKTFNRLAISRLLMSPQVKAANPQAWATMRLRQALYVSSALVIVPAVINKMTTGSATPPDTKFGEINLGNGEKFDMAKWTLVRRGLRISGAQALLEGQVAPRMRGEQPAALGDSASQAMKDVVRGKASPYAGPLPNAVSTLLTGKTALGFEGRQPGEGFPYVKAAVRQMNPTLGLGMTDQSTGDNVAKKLAQLAGLSETKESSVINNLRRQFLYKIGKADDASFPPSEYDALRKALLAGNTKDAQTAYDALFQTKLTQHVNAANPEHETKMDFQKYFERYAKAHGGASKEDESAFLATLTPHQQDLYDKVQAQQANASQLFFSDIQGKMAKKKPAFRIGF